MRLCSLRVVTNGDKCYENSGFFNDRPVPELKQYVEVITLTGNGLGAGAMRILRSLLEMGINIEFFRLRPGAFEDYEDYKEWYHVERFREFEFLRQHAEEAFALLDPQLSLTPSSN
jgi:hypothetical protein